MKPVLLYGLHKSIAAQNTPKFDTCPSAKRMWRCCGWFRGRFCCRFASFYAAKRMWRCCGWFRSLKWVVIEAYCSAIVLRSGRKGSVMGFATVSSSNLALFVQRSGCGGAVVGFASKGVPRALLSASPWNVHLLFTKRTLDVPGTYTYCSDAGRMLDGMSVSKCRRAGWRARLPSGPMLKTWMTLSSRQATSR